MSEKDESEKTKTDQAATSDEPNTDANEKAKSGTSPVTVFFIMLIAALWFNYKYDVLGLKGNFPFVEIEKVSSIEKQQRKKAVVQILENMLYEDRIRALKDRIESQTRAHEAEIESRTRAHAAQIAEERTKREDAEKERHQASLVCLKEKGLLLDEKAEMKARIKELESAMNVIRNP